MVVREGILVDSLGLGMTISQHTGLVRVDVHQQRQKECSPSYVRRTPGTGKRRISFGTDEIRRPVGFLGLQRRALDVPHSEGCYADGLDLESLHVVPRSDVLSVRWL